MSKVKARNCILVNYQVSSEDRRHDLCLVKEAVELEDGRIERMLRPVIDAKRDWYLTKPTHQKHKSHKSMEKIAHCRKFTTNQAGLINQVAKQTGQRPTGLRKLCQNPYIYGADVRIESVIKNKYMELWPEFRVEPTVGFMDYEWDISTRTFTFGSYTNGDTCALTVRRDMIKDCPNFDFLVQKLWVEELLPYIDSYYDKKNIKVIKKKKLHGDLTPEEFYLNLSDKKAFFEEKGLEFECRRDYKLQKYVVDKEIDVTKTLFDITHQEKPDYLTFWNGEADMTMLKEMCERHSYNMGNIVNDPVITLDPKYASFNTAKFQLGMTSKLDVNNAEKKIDPHERWHHLYSLSSWQFVDLMAVYATNRVHLPNKPSYALDYTVNSEIGLNKFKFKGLSEDLDNLDIEEWHNVMSRQYPAHYAIYAIFDTIVMQLLEDATADIRGQMYPKLGVSPIQNFKKNPRRLCDKVHFEFLKSGYIVGSTASDMTEEIDKKIYSTDGWIVTLDSGLHYGLGSYCLKGLPGEWTTFIPKVSDADITSSYPSTQRFLNIDKSTRVTEMIGWKGKPLDLSKNIGMDIASGHGVSVNYCTNVLNAPHLNGVVELWYKEQKAA